MTMNKLVFNIASVAKFKILCLFALVVLAGVNNEAWGQDYTSQAPGDWNADDTWTQSGYPTANKSVSISHNVTLNVDYSTNKNFVINNGGAINVAGGCTLEVKSEESGGGNFEIQGNTTIDGVEGSYGTAIFHHKIKGNSKTLTTNIDVIADRGVNKSDATNPYDFSYVFDNLNLVVNKNTFTNNRTNLNG
ncbi:MAG: hypothetical protein IKZ99_12465, partial [Salinivirgaceae bacterium]|nr:hypothetical protein [Salinivirgaceae bacterium]